MRAWAVVGGMLLLAVVVGCAPSAAPPAPSDVPIPASPSDTRPRLPIPTSLGPAKVDLPPRPYEIRLDGRDPCAVLTPQQRAELGLDRPPRRLEIDAYNYAPSCVLDDSSRDWGTTVSYATDIGGIETFTRTDTFDVQLETSTVRGFPAVNVRNRQLPGLCEVVIDVAQGQFVSVATSNLAEQSSPRTDLCDRNNLVAERVVQHLAS